MHDVLALLSILQRGGMAGWTIRKLDESIKAYLRLRSAKNGRSVEEEVRVILREVLQNPAESAAVPPPTILSAADLESRATRRADATAQPRVTLIIGGGIAACRQRAIERTLLY